MFFLFELYIRIQETPGFSWKHMITNVAEKEPPKVTFERVQQSKFGQYNFEVKG
jgi:hypothetical protein